MHTEETKDKGDKAQSTGFGFASMGHGMFEMMSKCCAGQGGYPACSTMMKGMMETMNNKPCCAPKTEDAAFEGKKK